MPQLILILKLSPKFFLLVEEENLTCFLYATHGTLHFFLFYFFEMEFLFCCQGRSAVAQFLAHCNLRLLFKQFSASAFQVAGITGACHHA